MRSSLILAKVIAIIIAMTLFAAARAQLFTVASVGKEEIALTVERGFNPSYYWSNFTDHGFCPWTEYRSAINILNPQFVSGAFHDIPVGATFVVPIFCATSEVSLAPSFIEALPNAFAEVPQQVVVELGPETLSALSRMISEAASQIEIGEPLIIAPAQTRTAPPAVEVLPEVAPIPEPATDVFSSSSSYWQRIVAWPYWIYVVIGLLILFALAWHFLPVFRRKRAHQDYVRLTEDMIEQGHRFMSLKSRYDKLEQDYKNVLALHTQVEREKNSQATLVTNLQKDIESLKQENADLTSRLKAVSDRFSQAQRRLKDLGEEEIRVVEVFEAVTTVEPETEAAPAEIVVASSPERKPRGGSRQQRAVSSKAKKAAAAIKKAEAAVQEAEAAAKKTEEEKEVTS